MFKKILILFAIITLLLAGGLSYVNKVLLPTKFKEMIVRKASQELGRTVSIKNLRYIPLKGIVASRVEIWEKSPQKKLFFTADEITVSILYLPFLAKGQIFIPSAVVYRPYLCVSRERTGEWNFTDILSPAERKKSKKMTPFYIANVSIVDAKIVIYDKTFRKDPIITLEKLNIRGALSFPKNVNLSILLRPSFSNPLKFLANLNYNFTTEELLSRVNIENFPIDTLASYINTEKFSLNQALLKVAAFEIVRKNKKIYAKGEAVFGNTKMGFLPDKELFMLPSLSVESLQYHENILKIKGLLTANSSTYKISDQKEFSGDVSYNFFLTKSPENITVTGKVSVDKTKAFLKPDRIFQGQVKGPAKLSFDFNKKTLEASGKLQIENSSFDFLNGKQIIASPVLTVLYTSNPATETKGYDYSGTLDFTSASVSGFPRVGKITEVSGKLSFKPELISSENLSGIAKETPFQVSGALENFQKPAANINLSFENIDLSKLNEFFLELLPQEKIALAGQAKLSARYQGSLNTIQKARLEISADFNEASLQTKKFPDKITGISGNASYLTNSLSLKNALPDDSSWKNLHLTYQDKNYILDGSLALNDLVLKASEGDLKIDLKSKLFVDRAKIISLNARYLNSHAFIEGALFYPTTEGLRLDIAANGGVDLEHILKIFPSLQTNFENLAPKSFCHFKGSFAGSLSNWRDWTLFGKVQSEEFFIKNYRFKDVAFEYQQRDHIIEKCILTSLFYKGKLKADIGVDLINDTLPYKLSFFADGIDLSALKNDTEFKDRPLAGIASLSYAGGGLFSDPLASARGQGTFLSQKGQLAHIDLLKGLGQLLFIPEHQNISFENATGDFIVKDQKILLKDGILKGNEMQLTCNGEIDFKGNLDLALISKFDQSTIRQSTSFKKAVALAFTGADNLVVVKVTGTLAAPKYHIIPEPLRIIEKTKDFILDSLPSIF